MITDYHVQTLNKHYITAQKRYVTRWEWVFVQELDHHNTKRMIHNRGMLGEKKGMGCVGIGACVWGLWVCVGFGCGVGVMGVCGCCGCVWVQRYTSTVEHKRHTGNNTQQQTTKLTMVILLAPSLRGILLLVSCEVEHPQHNSVC